MASVRREQRTRLMRPLLLRNKWLAWVVRVFAFCVCGDDGWLRDIMGASEHFFGVLS